VTPLPERRTPRNGLLEPGRNCWRVERARRMAFLRDGEAYFHAACEAMSQARRSILLLAWDVDSELAVNRHGVEGLPQRFGDFLDALARRRPGLHVHILAWDFASIFALEREKLPTVKLDWATHRRVHLFLDDRHPVGASHHQKVLVVDDAVAFVGGLDLTRQRWDTSAHDPADPERRDHSRPDGYPPFHDVQALVDDDAARALGTLARERWRLATGETLPRTTAMRDCWPPGVAASLVETGVGIARTIPAMDDQEEVREVERLYLDEIASARRTLYVENQYFTSHVVADALEKSLLLRDGPEIVVVLPCTSSGWLEEATMGSLRSRWILRLRAADHAGRLRIVYPGGPARGDVRVNVHAKVLVRDDDHVRVGSSNTSNRSMGFDTECDLAVDAADRRTREGIAHFRSELLGEHLGLTPRAVDALLRENGGSLVRLVDATAGGERAFEPLKAEEPSWLGAIEPAIELADPARRPRLGPPPRTSGRGLVRRLVLTGLGVIALTLAWTMTPLRHWLRPDALASAATRVHSHPIAMAGIVLAHAAAGLVAVPVTLLILATMLAFGPG
jgi:phospholipase D1/2